MEPINGKEEWEKTAYSRPLPPLVKPTTGRPKTRRNKKNDIGPPPDATYLKIKRTSLQCGACKAWGHNKRTCPGKVSFRVCLQLIFLCLSCLPSIAFLF